MMNRLKLAIHVFRGRPLIYKAHFKKSPHIQPDKNTIMDSCTFPSVVLVHQDNLSKGDV